jgi:hypothetical protein
MLHPVHGEIHGSLEHGQQAIHREDSAGERQAVQWNRHVLRELGNEGEEMVMNFPASLLRVKIDLGVLL